MDLDSWVRQRGGGGAGGRGLLGVPGDGVRRGRLGVGAEFRNPGEDDAGVLDSRTSC